MNTEWNLDHEQWTWKLVVAMLWLLQAINFIAYLLIVYLPANLASYSGIDDIAETPMTVAIFCAIPGVLICLTLISAPRVSRWPNVLLGIGFTLIKIVASIQILTGAIAGPNGEFLGGLFVNELWAIFAGALLVWCAWRIPDRNSTELTASEGGPSA